MKKKLLIVQFFLCCSVLKAQIITTVGGGSGAGDAANQLTTPMGLFVDDSEHVYVADLGNNRIVKFVHNNGFNLGVIVAGGHSYGDAANQLSGPAGLFLDHSGNIYVADAYNDRIQKFPPGGDSTTNGITVAGGNKPGNAANQLSFPSGVFVDDNGYIYVADEYNNRIQKFPPGSTADSNGITVAGGNGTGTGLNELSNPTGLFLDSAGNIYVADLYNNRIMEFPPGSTSATNGVTRAGGNGYGTAADQLYNPSGVYVDHGGNIYVADGYNNRVQKFPPGSNSATNGVTVAGGNGQGDAADQLDYAQAVYLDSSGNIFVTDANNFRIQEWSQLAGIDNVAPGTRRLALYPNPTTGAFTLETTNNIHQPFTIYDMLGNKVWQDMITADKQVVELKGLAAGSYMVRVGNGEVAKSEYFMIAK